VRRATIRTPRQEATPAALVTVQALPKPQPTKAAATEVTRWGVVALALGAGIVAAMQVGKVPPALPDLRADLALGMVMAGWVASVFNATGAAFGAVAGIVADGAGYRRAIMVSLVLLALASFAGGLAADGPLLLLARAVEGVGFVTISVAAPALILRATAPRDQRLALGLWGTWMPAGMAVMMLAAPLVLGAYGWRGLWLVNSGLILLFLALLAGATRNLGGLPGAVAARRRDWSDVRQAFTRPGAWLLAGCFSTYSIQWYAIMAWLPTFLVETQGRSVAAAAAMGALVVAVNVPGNLLGGWLLHRRAPRWLILVSVSASMGVLGLGIFSAWTPVSLKYGLALALSFIGGMLPASIFTGVPQHAPSPDQAGAVNGIIVQGSNLGSLSGPPAFAALVAMIGGWQASSWLLALAASLGVMIALAIRSLEKRMEASGSPEPDVAQAGRAR